MPISNDLENMYRENGEDSLAALLGVIGGAIAKELVFPWPL